MNYDCIIIGGGAAGLTAALVLARACRTVLVIDNGHQSNTASASAHNIFSRDGESPTGLYKIAQKQLLKYPTAKFIENTVLSVVQNQENLFEVKLENNTIYAGQTVLLAQGAQYRLPHIDGIELEWGSKIWHCPYCHGYEFKDKKILALGSPHWIAHMSVILPTWTRDISWSSLSEDFDENTHHQITNAGGSVVGKVTAIQHDSEKLLVTYASRTTELFDGALVETTPAFRDSIAKDLGCEIDSTNHIICDDHSKTSVEGVFVAGDETHVEHQFNIAVASGHKTAMSINTYLAELEREAERDNQ